MRVLNTPTIETQRLILRNFTENDLEAFFTIMSDKEVNRFLPWFVVTNMEEAKQLLFKNYLSNYEPNKGIYYAICLKEDNLPIGYINIADGEANDLGYGLEKNAGMVGLLHLQGAVPA